MSKGQRHGGGHMGGMRAGEKAKDFKGTMKKLLKYMSAYKLGIFDAFCSRKYDIHYRRTEDSWKSHNRNLSWTCKQSVRWKWN